MNSLDITSTDHRTNVTHVWRLTWATQTARCHGRVLRTWDADNPPLSGYENDGEPVLTVAQCDTCGTVRVPRCELERVA